jgi:predicted dehydrogenase
MHDPTELGIGVVGAGVDHWSGTAHIPAIAAQDGVALRAVVTSSPDSAAVAGQRWGVPATHELARVLEDDAVDVVVVTVRVPRHAEIVDAAIAAGKHVYCEWPLAVDTAQAAYLAKLSATRPDRVHVVGLQGRFSSHLRTAADLVAAGAIGRVLTANLRLYLPHGLLPRPIHRAHLRHRSVGANVLTIQAGHTLDMVARLLGPAAVVSARLWSAVPEFLVDTGERLPRDAPDNLVAVFDHDGVIAAVHVSQTGSAESFAMDVLGTAGALRLSSTGQPQFGGLLADLTPLGGSPAAVEPDPALRFRSPLPAAHPGHNVAALYAALADAVRTDRRDPILPRFADAVVLHRLLDDVAHAAVDTAMT